MKILVKTEFIDMPWKNGGGRTLELYRFPSDQSSLFLLRLSVASVRSGGAFSNFLGIDRWLMILNGEGIYMNGNSLTRKDTPLHFPGEKAIHCDLINGPVQDFNLMINRDWGTGRIKFFELKGTFTCEEDILFLYFPLEEILVILERGEIFERTPAPVIESGVTVYSGFST